MANGSIELIAALCVIMTAAVALPFGVLGLCTVSGSQI
jgi:hypothetical protein